MKILSNKKYNELIFCEEERKYLVNTCNNLYKENYKLQQENKQLKEEMEEQKKYNTELMLCNSGFNAILTELEEWLKEPEYFNGRKLRQDYITVMTTDVLDKIQELKEKYK